MTLPAGFQSPSGRSVDPYVVGQCSADEVVHWHVEAGPQL